MPGHKPDRGALPWSGAPGRKAVVTRTGTALAKSSSPAFRRKAASDPRCDPSGRPQSKRSSITRRRSASVRPPLLSCKATALWAWAEPALQTGCRHVTKECGRTWKLGTRGSSSGPLRVSGNTSKVAHSNAIAWCGRRSAPPTPAALPRREPPTAPARGESRPFPRNAGAADWTSGARVSNGWDDFHVGPLRWLSSRSQRFGVLPSCDS